MSDDHVLWFRGSDRPAPDVRLIIQWCGRVTEGVYKSPSGKRGERWLVPSDRGMRQLRARYGEVVDTWRPAEFDDYPDILPEPCNARRPPPKPSRAEDRRRTIRPSRVAPGPLTARDVEQRTQIEKRLLRGIRTLRAVPDRERAWFRQRTAWPEYVLDYPHEANTSFKPSRSDLADYLTACGWWAGLDSTDRTIVEMHARGDSLEFIAWQMRLTDDCCRNRYENAVSLCWRRAVAAGEIHAAEAPDLMAETR